MEPSKRPSGAERPDDLGSMISHDLRAALSDVVGGLQLMDMTQLSGANKAQMERILASSEALVVLMDELSANLQSYASDPAKGSRAVDLTEFLDRTRRRWTGVAGQQNIDFELACDGTLPHSIAIPRTSLERVLSNIVENSFKYTAQGKVVLSVRLGKRNDLVFQVQDSGPGFSKEAMQTLFEFGGRPTASAKPGSGIGLYSVKRLLEHLGGKIVIENTPDGASVTASFPASSWRPVGGETDHPSERGASGHMLTGLRFLLAEDNKTSQLVALNMLERLGARVNVVDNGQQALNMIETGHFDVVLLDIEMPEKSGIEVIQEVRARGDDKAALPLIALTAYVLEDHRRKIMAAGADGTISKPVTNTNELGRTINNILNGLTSFTERQEEAGQRRAWQPFIDNDVFFGLKKSIGDEAFYAILDKMKLDLSSIRRDIAEACKVQDLAELRRASHVLISLAGAVGASRLLSHAQSLNVYANEGNLERVAVRGRACEKDIALLIEFVEAQGGAV